nr:hypothetical protein [Tanacetum cinerariifolium]
MALFTNMNHNKNVKRDSRTEKRELNQEVKGFRHCTNYGQDGHSVEHCFKNIGYPDWYKGKKNKRIGKMVAHINFRPETPFDMGYENEFFGKGFPHKCITPKKAIQYKGYGYAKRNDFIGVRWWLGWSITSSHGNQLGGDEELTERRRVRRG